MVLAERITLFPPPVIVGEEEKSCAWRRFCGAKCLDFSGGVVPPLGQNQGLGLVQAKTMILLSPPPGGRRHIAVVPTRSREGGEP